MGGTIRKIVKNPIGFVKKTVAGVGSKKSIGGAAQQYLDAKSKSSVQKKVVEEKKKITPDAVTRGVMAGESQAPEARANRRRGRRSNVMTGSRGVTGTTATTKKTLLGG
jgi:hypothetical protein